MIRWRSMISSTAAGWNSRTRIEWAPFHMAVTAHPEPPMWNRGMVTRTTEVASRLHSGDTGGMSVPRLRLVSMTPLGRPVVPEV